jgi:hypothetical protein
MAVDTLHTTKTGIFRKGFHLVESLI